MRNTTLAGIFLCGVLFGIVLCSNFGVHFPSGRPAPSATIPTPTPRDR